MEDIEQNIIDVSMLVEDLFIRVSVSKNLVYSGKCCQANEKLQGALTKCSELINSIGKLRNELVNKNNPECGNPEKCAGT